MQVNGWSLPDEVVKIYDISIKTVRKKIRDQVQWPIQKEEGKSGELC